MKTTLFAVLVIVSMINVVAQSPESRDVEAIQYKTIKAGGLDIFYREAGNPSKPTILLLHGFPSSSHMYRDLLRDLAPTYHVIAPDYPGFGLSDCPGVDQYEYTFDNISTTMDHFIDALKLTELILCVQDYGGPIGFRIASRRPKLIRALIIQNANAYNEGLGDAIAPMRNYFTNPNKETEKGARGIFSSTKWQYTDGAGDVSLISPDSYIVDQFFLDRPGNDKIQLALFRDYKNNLALYPKWHSYFREMQPPALILWGRNDKIFIAPGAEAYKRDLKNIEVHLLNGGHFVLEEYHREAAKLIDSFLTKNSITTHSKNQTTSNQEIIKQFLEQVRSGKHPDQASDFMADTVVAHQVNSENQAIVKRTPQNYADHIRDFLNMYGNYSFEITELLADGDKVYVRWLQVGKHLSVIDGYAPTGKPLTEIASCVYRLTGSKIVEYWVQADRLGFEKQLELNKANKP